MFGRFGIKMKSRFLGLILTALVLLPIAAWAETFEGRVVGIADGDTITVLTDGKRQVRVRLYGVDCPESKQAYGTRARQFTRDKVAGKRVEVEVQDLDRYGRTVGIVTIPDGSILNADLLDGGMAWLYSAYCKAPVCREWKAREAAARKAKVGLWADANPTPPWDFRKAQRSGKTWVPSPSSQSQTVGVVYSGNTRSGIFHSSSCRYFDCRRCTARFSSRDAAIQAGYQPCKVCRP